MTINEAKKELQATLAVLDKLDAAVSGEKIVLSVTVGNETEVHLASRTMRSVAAACPEIETSLEPLGDGFEGERYWSMDIDGVNVFTVLLDGETPEGGDEDPGVEQNEV